MSRERDDEDALKGGQARTGAVATAREPAVIRWADLDGAGADGAGPVTAAGRHPAEPRIARLFANVPAPPLLGGAALSRIEARLRENGAQARTRGAGGANFGSGYRRFAMGSGLGVFTLLISGAVIAGGGVGAWWTLSRPHSEAVLTAPTASDTKGARRSRRVRAPKNAVQHDPSSSDRAGDVAQGHTESELGAQEGVAAPAMADPATADGVTATTAELRPLSEQSFGAPVPAPSRGAERRVALARPAATNRSRPSGSAPLAQATPSGLSEEARLLNRATIALRQRRNGIAALASVDEYLRRFPGGILANEAQRLRVDALLLTGDNEEVLRALTRLDLEPTGRGLELLTIRGELRAGVDCASASRDFDQVLRHQRVGRLAERALYGRAVCALRERREQAAREDARVYLERFPGGRFAPEARQIATGSSSSPDGAHRRSGDSSSPGRDPGPKVSPPSL